MDNISELLKKVEILPTSPALLPKLSRALGNIDNADIDDVVDIIAYDSALTAKLLQIANSAYFRSAIPITNVGEAVSQIGYDAVYLLAASISSENFLRPPPGTGLDAVLLWKHSVTTAFGAQHIAWAAQLDGNLLFTAGLLHDLGKVILAGAHGTAYTAMFNPATRGPLTLVEWEKKHYGYDHAEIGAALLERWKLPKPIVTAVRFHHKLHLSAENAPPAACICLGNALSRTLELPAFSLDAANPDIPPALQALNLTADDLAALWDRIHENWEFVQNLFDLRK